MAGAMCLDLPLFSETIKSFGKERLKVGILSDIHIKLGGPKAPKTHELFEKALRYFRSRGVDAVLIAGDLADYGTRTELQMVADIWYKVFPSDKGADGRKVEKLFIYGNHDIDAWKMSHVKKRKDYEDIKADGIFNDIAGSWERCFNEKWSPIYTKEVKGYKFIGGQYANSKYMPGLEEYLAKEHLPAQKPFFYFQHCHPKGTCSAPWTWGQDDGTVTGILSKYPNCICFSGHSHTPLVDERTIWQGAFTSVGTASLFYLVPFGGRENSKAFGLKGKVPSQMKEMSRDAHNGQIMTVYDDCITLDRLDMESEKPVGKNWVIPTGAAGAPLSFEARAKKSVAPQFPEDAAVTLTEGIGQDRYKVEQQQITLHFPTVKGDGDKHPHAFDYEIQLEIHDVDTGKAMLTKRVYSPGYFREASCDADETICVFGLNEIPVGVEYRFAVRPCECFGRKGEPIYSAWQSPREAAAEEVVADSGIADTK